MADFVLPGEGLSGKVAFVECDSPLVFDGSPNQWIYHYTNLDVFKKILLNGTLRFSRVDTFDDGKEARAFPAGLAKKFYASCWTCDGRDSPLAWRSFYTSKDANPSRRIRLAIRRKPFQYMQRCVRTADGKLACLPIEIALPFKFGDLHTADYSVWRLNMAKSEWFGGRVKYLDNVENFYSTRIVGEAGGLTLEKVHEFGMYKDCDWREQQEYRFVLVAGPRIDDIGTDDESEADVNNQYRILMAQSDSMSNCTFPSVKYIDMPINLEAVADMRVLTSPLANEIVVSEVQEVLEKFCPLGAVERSALSMTY